MLSCNRFTAWGLFWTLPCPWMAKRRLWPKGPGDPGELPAFDPVQPLLLGSFCGAVQGAGPDSLWSSPPWGDPHPEVSWEGLSLGIDNKKSQTGGNKAGYFLVVTPPSTRCPPPEQRTSLSSRMLKHVHFRPLFSQLTPEVVFSVLPLLPSLMFGFFFLFLSK